MEIRKGKVLIVDDDPSIQRLLMQKLASEGYYCVVATDGEQAISEAERHTFAVVLLDIRLPGISGLEVLRYLIRMQPLVCVIMISGHGDLPIAVESMKLGAFDYISKPFDMNDLTVRSEKALQRNRILCEKDNRENALNFKLKQQEDELRGLVGQTVQALVREHLVERQLSQRKRGRPRIEPEQLKELAQTVQSFVDEPETDRKPDADVSKSSKKREATPLAERLKRLRRSLVP